VPKAVRVGCWVPKEVGDCCCVPKVGCVEEGCCWEEPNASVVVGWNEEPKAEVVVVVGWGEEPNDGAVPRPNEEPKDGAAEDAVVVVVVPLGGWPNWNDCCCCPKAVVEEEVVGCAALVVDVVDVLVGLLLKANPKAGEEVAEEGEEAKVEVAVGC